MGLGGKILRGVYTNIGNRLLEGLTNWLTVFCQENTLVIPNNLFQQQGDDSTQGHHQIVNTQNRFIIVYATKDGEALYSLKKKKSGADSGSDHGSLLKNSGIN